MIRLKGTITDEPKPGQTFHMRTEAGEDIWFKPTPVSVGDGFAVGDKVEIEGVWPAMYDVKLFSARKMRQCEAISRKEAAALQIDAAVRLFLSGEIVPSITLAGAAEGMLPDVDAPYLFPMLKSGWAERKGTEKSPFNEIRNWLKHATDGETKEINTNNAIIELVRAISKYTSVFGVESSTQHCEEFHDWMSAHRPDWLSGKVK